MWDKNGSDDKETSLYLVQIRYLEEQLDRCQLRCDVLEKQNRDLASQSSALEKDTKDAVHHLKRSLAARKNKLDELHALLRGQQLAAEEDRRALNLQHMQWMQKLQEQMNRLNLGNAMQTAKIEEQKEQMMQRLKELQNLQSLKKHLVSQKDKHEAAVNIKKAEVGLEQQRVSVYVHPDLDDFIRMVISDTLREERAQHSKRMDQEQFIQTDRTDLQEEIDTLQDSETNLCSERDSLKTGLNLRTRQISSTKKEVEQLSEEQQQLKEELKDLCSTHQQKVAQTEAVRQRLGPLSEEYRQKTAEVDHLGHEIQKERSRRMQLERAMQQGAIVLRYLLTDSEKASQDQWKVQRLLDILESTAPPPPAPPLRRPLEDGNQRPTDNNLQD